MSDNELRERIAGLLITHPSGLRAVGDPPDWPWAVADAILAMPGIAVVELPEPDYVDEADEDGYKGYGFNGGVFEGWYAHGGRVYAAEGDMSPKDARDLAAVLLAAAEYAEKETK